MNDIVDAAALAYVWGLPLVTMHRTLARHRSQPGLARRDRLSTAGDRDVVAPNNDTLYASGWFDLGAGDVWIDVAPTDGRYWSVMLLDAYTNVRYVSRRTHGAAGATVCVRFDPTARAGGAAKATDAATDVIGVGTRTLWALARVVVHGPADLAAAQAVLARIRMHGCAPARPAGARTEAATSPRPNFLDELAAAVAVDPPAAGHPAMPGSVAALLAERPPDELVAAGEAEGRRRIAARGGGADRTANGWGTRVRGADFGDDVVYRAAFAATSLGGHLPIENRSFSRIVDGTQPALLRFEAGAEPPVNGFWSVTVYGPDLQFVANPIDRYSLGDRSPDLVRGPDGALEIELAETPSGPTTKWLPTPGGPCVVTLRAYEGAPEVVAATWFPPDLIPVTRKAPT